MPAWTGIGLLALVLLTGCGEDGGGRPSMSIFLGERFLNIAHRGGGRLAPEHTLAAYENAVNVGADIVELDLHGTADGRVVSIHDSSVDRTTDGTGLIRDLTFDEVRSFDAGYRFSRDGGQTYPWRGMGLQIPTVREALELLDGVPLVVEFKAREVWVVDETIAAFREFDALDRVVFASFPQEPVRRVRELVPDVLTALSAGELAQLALHADRPDYVPPGEILQPPASIVDQAYVELAHRVGLKVHPWTINDRAEMRRLIDLGVDGVFTDDPVLLGVVLAE